jgi:hypothetical protein
LEKGHTKGYNSAQVGEAASMFRGSVVPCKSSGKFEGVVNMKKTFAALFAIVLTVSLSSFAFAQADSSTAKPADPPKTESADKRDETRPRHHHKHHHHHKKNEDAKQG